jgi:hypothetical protein
MSRFRQNATAGPDEADRRDVMMIFAGFLVSIRGDCGRRASSQ